MASQNKKLVIGILLSLLVFNILAWGAVFSLSGNKNLKVIFFDVGQGDAIFIEAPNGQQILVDGGPDSTILEKLGKEIPFWDRTIDLIILTHPEKDHMQGLLDVLKRYEVENILWTGVARDTPEFQEWMRLINEEKTQEGAEITIARAGQKICIGNCSRNDFERVRFDVLFPFDSLESQESKNSNDSSIIVRLNYRDKSFLFLGDASVATEKKLIEKGISVDSDILKVGHHGSKTSSDDKFIAEVSPEAAVISVGKDNKYGHPHKEVLDTLGKYGIKIFRTDNDGDIKIISDGKNYAVSSF